jgi:serine phosphatase RsbU (regulator of sigma subunit)
MVWTRKLYIYIFILAASLVASGRVHAQSITADLQDKTSISRRIWLDPQGKGTIDLIRQGQLPESWRETKETVPALFNGVLWVQLKIQNHTADPLGLYLEDQWAMTNRIDLFRVIQGQLHDRAVAGDHLPIRDRVHRHRFPLFYIDLLPGEQELWLRYETNDVIGTRLTLWSKESFDRHRDREQLILGLLFGFLLVMPFYNLCIYFVLRIRAYLHYALYVSNFAVFQLCLQGLAFKELMDHPWWNDQGMISIALGCIITVIPFTREFLQLDSTWPLGVRISRVLSRCSWFCIPLTHFWFHLGIYAAIVLNLCIITWILASSVYSSLRGHKPAYLFFGAWLTFIVGDAFSIFHILGTHDYALVGRWGMLSGGAIEVVLISFGLAWNVHRIRRQATLSQLRESRLLGHMETARAIQESLIFKDSSAPGIVTASLYLPAESTGGDWFSTEYDEVNGRFYAFMGDVTDHGISSAMVTGAVSGAMMAGLRSVGRQKLEPEAALLFLHAQAHEVVSRTGARQGRLMSMNFLCLDLKTGLVCLLNAGHHEILHYSGHDRSISGRFTRGSLLGMSEQVIPNVHCWQLAVGDRLCCYTDGLIENYGEAGRKFRMRELKGLLQQDLDCQTILTHIMNVSQNIWGAQRIQDDVSLLLIQWLGPMEREDSVNQTAG